MSQNHIVAHWPLDLQRNLIQNAMRLHVEYYTEKNI